MEQLILLAMQIGFDEAVCIDPKALEVRADVRDMCAADKCGIFAKNWSCPPACGTLEQCGERMRGFERGLLLQSVGRLRKAIDSKCYRETERLHNQRLQQLYQQIKADHPKALCLGAGGCRVCGKCAYPEPCRFPDKAMSSMEAYGLFVTQVCKDAKLPYHHGEMTITFTGCILF